MLRAAVSPQCRSAATRRGVLCGLVRLQPLAACDRFAPASSSSGRPAECIAALCHTHRHSCLHRWGAVRLYATASGANGSKASAKGDGGQKASSDQDSGDESESDKEARARAWRIALCAWAAYFALGYIALPNERMEQCTLDDFFNVLLPSGEVEGVVIRLPFNQAFIRLHPGAVISGFRTSTTDAPMFTMRLPDAEQPGEAVRRFEGALEARERTLGIAANHRVAVKFEDWRNFAMLQLTVFFVACALSVYAAAKGRIKMSMKSPLSVFDNMRKANFKLVDSSTPTSSRPKVKFDDVIGLHEAKVEVMEFVDYMKRPTKYTALGAKLPKGAVLLGPPGCGKTMLAKAVAGEANVPFMASAGSDFVELIGGLGAARVRSLFKEAKQRAPCIIYIDEIDALGRRRSGEADGHGNTSNSELEQTLNQLLVEMDGMESDKGVIIMASTNRPDILDKALLRPGRFDRHITIDLPTLIERGQLFDYYLGKIKLHTKPSTYSGRLAQLTPGFTGADIANVVNEAAIQAASGGAHTVKAAHMEAAMERVLAGTRKRSDTVSPHERKVVAWHEAGHALTAWMLDHADALLKVSIIPRTSAALGFAQYAPTERRLLSKDELFDRMCVALGGRAAESLTFNRITTGAEDDLKKVTRVAYDQVQVYGMNDIVGPLSFGSSAELKESDFQKKPYSKKLKAVMDAEASKLIGVAYRRTERILRDNQHLLDKLAEALLQRETLNYDDVRHILGCDPAGGSGKRIAPLADAADALPPPANEQSA